MRILGVDQGMLPEGLNEWPERSALLTTRRLSIAGFAAVGAVIQVIASLTALPSLTLAQILSAVVSISCVVIGVLGRTTAFLWLTVIGAAMIVGSNALPTNGARWVFINSAALFGAFALGTIVSRLWLPVAAAICLVGLHLAWAAQPNGVIATGFSAWNGWIPPIQAALLCLAAHAMWTRSTRTASRLDRSHARDQARIAIERERAERGLAFRAAAIRIHESLLNDIRYVLSVDRPDQDRLALALDTMGATTELPLASGNLERLEHDVSARAGLPLRLTLSESARAIMLDVRTYDALCAALVEIARNRARHDGAESVEAHADTAPDQLRVSIPGARLRARDVPGIGLNTVITANLRDVAGQASMDDLGVIVTVPIFQPSVDQEDTRTSPFARGRSLLTFAVGSLTLTGVLYFIALLTESDLGIRGGITLVLAAIGALVALGLPLRSRSLTATQAVLLALPAIAVPITLSGAMPSRDCVPLAQTTASALNVTGFMILVTGLWCVRRWLIVPLLGVWLAAIAWYLTHVTRDCGEYLLIPILNSVLIMPVVILVVSLATAIHARTGQERDRARVERRKRLAWSLAQQDVNRHLQDLVELATGQLRQIAQAEQPAEHERRRLRCTEALVRAAVQVDVQTTGAFGLLSLELVEESAREGVPIEVRALEVSNDVTPIPEAAIAFIREFLTGWTGGAARVSAFTDGDRDYLTVSRSGPLPTEVVPEFESGLIVDGVEISVDVAQPEVGMEYGHVLMATRRIRMDHE